MDVGNDHPLIDGLAHIIYCEQSCRNTGQRLHLYPCLSFYFDPAERSDGNGVPALFFRLEGHFRICQIQNMAHRDELAGLLGAHDARHLSNGQDVSLFYLSPDDRIVHFPADENRAAGDRLTACRLLSGYIDHISIALFIKMCEFHNYLQV